MPTGTKLRQPLARPWEAPHTAFVPLPIPDPITFAIDPRWLNRRLYRAQATMLKIIFLREDLFTDYDYELVFEWEAAFAVNQDNGLPPGTLIKMRWLKANGHKWFREIVLVMGRRGGKGYICSLAMAYVLWNFMSTLDPQEAYGIDRDKQLTCQIFAGRKEQARDFLWRDLINVIQGGVCFAPYISKPLGESLTIYAPADKMKRRKLAARGVYSGLDEATFKIDPSPATPGAGRGGAMFMMGMDEMAHMINSGANRAAEEVWRAATPALDQFKKDAFIACPSSPWEMIGQFYVEWQQAQEIDPLTGEFVHPEKFMLQLTSWDPYRDWAHTHEIPLFPDSFVGDLKEYAQTGPPKLATLKLAIQEYDDAMRKLEKADPDNFKVERLAHWQTSLDAYLDPDKIAAMFDADMSMTATGILAHHYEGHADAAAVNDLFGVAVAHTAVAEDGFLHVVFDYVTHWDPADAVNHTLDYVMINGELWKIIRDFPVDNFTFDQFNSQYFVSDLTAKAMKAQLPKRVSVFIVPETAPYNLRVAETFKVALNQGWIHSPYYEEADLELRFLQFKSGKVTHQTAGPVQHDDVARSMMAVTHALLEKQVTSFLTEGSHQLVGGLPGGSKPWMMPSAEDNNIIEQFGQSRLGRGAPYMGPARGRPDFGVGRGPFPRTPGGMGGGRGRGWR